MKVSKSIITAIAVGLAVHYTEAQTVKKNPKTTSATTVSLKNETKKPKIIVVTKPIMKDSLSQKTPKHEPGWCPPCGRG